jgi:hypothetical protein
MAQNLELCLGASAIPFQEGWEATYPWMELTFPLELMASLLEDDRLVPG